MKLEDLLTEGNDAIYNAEWDPDEAVPEVPQAVEAAQWQRDLHPDQYGLVDGARSALLLLLLAQGGTLGVAPRPRGGSDHPDTPQAVEGSTHRCLCCPICVVPHCGPRSDCDHC